MISDEFSPQFNSYLGLHDLVPSRMQLQATLKDLIKRVKEQHGIKKPLNTYDPAAS